MSGSSSSSRGCSLRESCAPIPTDGGSDVPDTGRSALLLDYALKLHICTIFSSSPQFDNIESYGDCLEVKREYYQNCFLYCQRATSSIGTVNKNSSYSLVGPWVRLLCFLGCMNCLYVGVCFVLPWTVQSFPFMLWRWRNKLKWAPFELFAPSPLLRVRSWLHPF